MYNNSLFIFRRDLRVFDNTALNKALSMSKNIITCFIFDPRQTSNNPYKGENSFNFMLSTLKDLELELSKNNQKLLYLDGLPHEVIISLIKKHKIEAVFFNHDYTPFSISRDQQIVDICNINNIKVHREHDLLLHEPSLYLKQDGSPYTVFTAFYKNIQKYPVIINNIRKPNNIVLKNIDLFKNYDETRDIPDINTTGLSKYNKFGVISVREVYYNIIKNLGENHTLIKQLYWRDFFTLIGFYFPHVFGHAFKNKYNNIKWSNDKTLFNKWCLGQTGFPIVDAGMRELNQTGFMHNRVRMITASFLIKDLHIDWRWGEKYFATKLTDYDPAVNNGNWQWVASTGCDAQPYFRIFNPWRQQEKFDPQCLYIKKWVPELKNHTPKEIHSIYKNTKTLVDHDLMSRITKDLYRC